MYIADNTASHLIVWLKPSAVELKKEALYLLSHYVSLVTNNAKRLKEISNCMVSDAYFSKNPIVDALRKSGLYFISRLRNDSVLKYKYMGKANGKKGRPKQFNGRVHVRNLGANCFYLDLSLEEIKIYSTVLYSKAFKRDKKLAVTIFFKEGKEITRKLYFSNNLQ